MRPYSRDLRERVLADHQAGQSFAELGRKCTVSAEWVLPFVRRHEPTEEIDARPPRIKKLPSHRRHEARLRQAVADNPGQTLDALGLEVGSAEPGRWAVGSAPARPSTPSASRSTSPPSGTP